MSDLIFATPWWLPTGLIVVGVILVVGGNGRQQKGTRNAGVGLLVVAVVVVLLSHFVDTDRKRAARQTKELIAAVQDRDWSKMTALLDDDATVSTPFGQLYGNRREIVDEAKALSERHGLKAVGGSMVRETQDNAGIVVLMDTSATVDAGGMGAYPVPSVWEFDWQETAGEWHVHQITCVSIGGKTDADTIRTAIGR